jgi:hypothetical protein
MPLERLPPRARLQLGCRLAMSGLRGPRVVQPISAVAFCVPQSGKFTSPAEHRAVANKAPRVCGDPFVPSPFCRFGFLARWFQCFESAGQLVVRLGWELQRKTLPAGTLLRQPFCLPRAERCNNRAMVRVMDQRQSERNLPKIPNISLPGRDIVWLGVMPSPGLPVAPCPLPLCRLQPTLP